MSKRAVKWIVGLGVVDAVVLVLTIHATATYSGGGTENGTSAPSVLSLGQAVGYIVSAVLLLAIVMIVKESRR